MINNLMLYSFAKYKFKSMKTSVLIVALLFAITFPATVMAGTVVRTGDSVNINSNQVVENNLYVTAGSFIHSGEVKGDVYVVGGSATTNGPIGADLTIVAGTAQIHEKISGDLRVIGGEVLVASEVEGDVFVIGGQLKILSSANIKGGVYFYGNKAEIDGEVAGFLMGNAEEFNINNVVGGVDVVASKIVLGERASIKGDLTYPSYAELQRALGAVIEGRISVVETDTEHGVSYLWWSFWFSVLFISAIIFHFYRSGLEEFSNKVQKQPLKAGAVGLLTLILLPFIMVLTVFSLFSVWLSLAFLLTWLFLISVGFILLPIVIGDIVISWYKNSRNISWVTVPVGLLIVVILLNIPFIGGLLLVILLSVIIGQVLLGIKLSIKSQV